MLRWIQITLTAAVAGYMLIVVFNNLTDYGSNYAFVQGVLNMETTFPDNALKGRAIHSPVLHHLCYALIILWEFACAALCTVGSLRMLAQRTSTTSQWTQYKSPAALGLLLGLLLWLSAFLTVGGEWFVMWQSDIWSAGQDAAGRMFNIFGICLIVLYLPEGASDSSA